MMGVSADDRLAIMDFVARYCWAFDDGDVESWCSLWLPDGEFVGVAPEPVRGTEALRQLAIGSDAVFKGHARHVSSNLTCSYETGDHNTIIAKLYNHVSGWGPNSGNLMMALCTMTLVRREGHWRLKTNDVRVLPWQAPA